MRRLALVVMLCLFCCACLEGCSGPEETGPTQTPIKRGRGGVVDPKAVEK
jgi:hypothetical protein